MQRLKSPAKLILKWKYSLHLRRFRNKTKKDLTAGADITTDLEFSLWKGNSKIYGEYVTTSKTVSYEYTPATTATYRINFRLRDYGYDGPDQTFYLDNVIIRNTTLALIEENNYYPFGLKHQGYNDDYSSNRNAVATKFKYNGKELNDELGLELYDYGWRMYDPTLGRFHTIDPLAESYYFLTPYGYVAGNPVACRDENGEWINFVVGAVVGAATDYVFQVASNYIEGNENPWTDVSTNSIVASGISGAAGVGIANIVNKGAKTLKLVNSLSKTKVGKIVAEQTTQAVGDVISSVTGSAIQGNDISVDGVLIDVAAGQLGKATGDFVESKAKSSPNGVNKQIDAKNAQAKSDRKPNNQRRSDKASQAQANYDNHGTGRSVGSSVAASNATSKTLKKTDDE